MKLNKYLIGILFLIIAGGLSFYSWTKNTNKNNNVKQTTQGVQIGNMAPDFSLKTLDGRLVKLAELRGKKVIVNFWATWCPPCKAEIPEFERFYKENRSLNTEILAVDITAQEKSKETVNGFVKSFGITYQVVLDETGAVADMYRISAIPTTYIIDEQGIIRQKVTGAMQYQALNEAVTKLR